MLDVDEAWVEEYVRARDLNGFDISEVSLELLVGVAEYLGDVVAMTEDFDWNWRDFHGV